MRDGSEDVAYANGGGKHFVTTGGDGICHIRDVGARRAVPWFNTVPRRIIRPIGTATHDADGGNGVHDGNRAQHAAPLRHRLAHIALM